jgi:hypothetical protein
MHFACRINKARNQTNTQSGQQWLHEYASMLRYTYISSLVDILSLMLTVQDCQFIHSVVCLTTGL